MKARETVAGHSGVSPRNYNHNLRTFAFMSMEEIKRLASDEVQEYIFSHRHEDEKKLLLKQRSVLGLPSALVAQQMAAGRKAESRFPFFYKTKGILYPPSVSVEQSSSEATARFKAEFIQQEVKKEKAKVADLTGGFGTDSFFFSRDASGLDYVEPDALLNEIVQHNFRLLKRNNVHCHQSTAEDFLKKTSRHYDFIYLDPSRRDSKARKVFALSDCVPNVVELLPDLLQRTDYVFLKASPLLDIKQALRELAAVKSISVVSVANECKELLFLLEKDFSKEPIVKTVNLDQAGVIKQAFDFYLSDEEASVSTFALPKNYIYEPNTAVLKSGAFKCIGNKYELKKIHVNTHFYTSDVCVRDFPGRIFEVEELGVEPKSLVGKYANLICRNYPLSPEELKKKLKTKDGGEKYVLAFSGQNKKYLITAKRLA